MEIESLESRKIQISAGGSFFVVLPKEWSKDIGLRKGDRLDVQLEDDGSIRLIPFGAAKEHFMTVTLKTDEYASSKSLDLQIKAYYMAGCDEINIASSKRLDSELKKLVKSSVSELIGVEVSDETSDKLTLRAIVDPSGFPLENILKRMTSLSLSMYNDSVKAFEDRDLALAGDVTERGKEAMKLYRLMVRQLLLAQANKNTAKSLGIVSSSSCIPMGILARDISRLIYHISSIADNVSEIIKGEISYGDRSMELMLKIFDKTKNMIEKTFQAFNWKEKKLAYQVIEQMNEIHKLDEMITAEIFETLGDVHSVLGLSRVLREVRRVAGFAVSIADDTIFYGSTISDIKNQS